MVAIEGGRDAFRCQQIMRDGPGGRSDVDYRSHCLVSQAMSQAELAWRRELAAQTLGDLRDSVEAKHPNAPRMARNRLDQPVR